MYSIFSILRASLFLKAAVLVCLFSGLSGEIGRAVQAANRAPVVGEILLPAVISPRSDVSLSVEATDPDGDTLSYIWDAGDGTVVAGGKTFTHQWTVGGSFAVSVTVRDGRGGVVTSRRTVGFTEHFNNRNSGTVENLNAVASNGSLAVAVGANGAITTSTDGVTWTVRSLPVPSESCHLKAVLWDGRSFLTVGCGETFGVIYRSTDGVNWVQCHRGDGRLYAVASSGALTLAVGDQGTLLRSTDGVNWTAAPAPDTRPKEGVVYGGVAYGNGTFVLTSTVDASGSPAGSGGPTGASVTLGSTVSSGATLTLGGGNNQVFGGAVGVSGNMSGGSLTGAGLLTLAGSNTSTGSSTISAGTLSLTGGGVTVILGGGNSSGTLVDSALTGPLFTVSGGTGSSTGSSSLGSTVSSGAGVVTQLLSAGTLTIGTPGAGHISISTLTVPAGQTLILQGTVVLTAGSLHLREGARLVIVKGTTLHFGNNAPVTFVDGVTYTGEITLTADSFKSAGSAPLAASQAPAEFAAPETTFQAKLFTSSDAITWTDRSTEARLDASQPFHRVAFLNGRFVISGANVGVDAAGNPTRSLFASSTDNGKTFGFTPPIQGSWSVQSLPTGVAFGKGVDLALNCNDMAFFKDTFLVVAGGGQIAQSDLIEGTLPAQITHQPLAAKVTVGGNVSLSVKVTGKGPLAFQWFKDGALLEGGTLAAYRIEKATVANAGTYTVSVRNSGGEVVSDAARLTVAVLPVFVDQPQGTVLRTGSRLELSVNVTSTETATYQWRKNGAKIGGATRRTFEVAAVRTSDSATYDVVVTNSAGSVSSVGAMVRVNTSVEAGAEVPPVIVRQPVGKVVASGGVLELSVSAMAPAGTSLSYQWLKDGLEISGATGATYSAYVSTQDGGRYSVYVTAGTLGVTSEEAAVVIIPRTLLTYFGNWSPDSGQYSVSYMRITSQPVGGRFLARTKVTLSVNTAEGIAPLTYQWLLDGVPLRGGRSAKLVLSGVSVAQSGRYTVKITDATGLTILSEAANVQVQDVSSLVGTYQGLLMDDAKQRAGRVTVTLTATGSFSGRLEYLGSVYVLAGALDGERAGRRDFTRGDGLVPITWGLKFDENGVLVAGVLESDTLSYGYIPRFGFNTTTNKAPQAGRYSVLIGTEARYMTPNVNNPSGLLGPGSFVVSAGGIVTASGRLLDATPFSMSAMLSPDGTVPWYNRLYATSGGKPGCLTGLIPANNGNPDAIASIQWQKPTQTDGFFAAGFLGNVTMAVSPYSLPKVGRVLSESNGVLNFTFTRADGSFLTKEFSLSATHILAVTGENPEQLNLQLNRQTGLVSGSLVDPVSGQTLKLEGVTLQTQVGEISGLGFGGTQLGAFTLTP